MWHVILVPWPWRAEILAVLGGLAVLYVLGWKNLRRAGYPSLVSRLRLLAYLGGLGTVGVALLSPLAVFQSYLLTVHMIQHELLMIVAPPLVLLARPMAISLWGMPRDVRWAVAQCLRRGKPLRRQFDLLTRPAVAWTVSTGVLWIWHVPVAYNAVETHRLLHDAQHVAFFVSGLVFWWPVIQAPFQYAITLPMRVGYLVAGITQRSLLGGVLTLFSRPLYSHYSHILRIGGLSPLGDQRLAGGIMWFVSGLILLGATIVAIWRAPNDEPSPAPVSRAADRTPDSEAAASGGFIASKVQGCSS